MRRFVSVLAAVALLVAGCQWPRDADRTLADVRGGVLRVGITEDPPWTEVADDGSVDGVEVRLVEQLARRLDTRVEWYPGSESSLMAALQARVLDLVVGGLDAAAPWLKEAALTRPYVTLRTVVAVPSGVAVPENLAGVRVAVPAGTAEVAALIAERAVPVPVVEVTGAEGLPVVVGEWDLDRFGLREAGHELAKHDHVWAVPPGENAWLVEVERFLLALSRGSVERLLVEVESAQELP